MIGFLITFAVGLAFVAYLKYQGKKEDAAREATFRTVMLSLEEKAKKEGTFVVSYFDTPTK